MTCESEQETLCEVVDDTEKVDPESWIAVRTTTHTPVSELTESTRSGADAGIQDVPSGAGFFVKTRTVFTWSATGGTKVKITTEVEWTKVSRLLGCQEGRAPLNLARNAG